MSLYTYLDLERRRVDLVALKARVKRLQDLAKQHGTDFLTECRIEQNPRCNVDTDFTDGLRAIARFNQYRENQGILSRINVFKPDTKVSDYLKFFDKLEDGFDVEPPPRFFDAKRTGHNLQFTLQGRLLKVRLRHLSKARFTGGRRGGISEFSHQSRKRLLELFATLDYQGTPVFLTLTYGQDYPDTQVAKNHLRALLERFRRAYPDCSAIWRIEYQQRGAPHFHLIFFNLPFIDYSKINAIWGEVIGREFWDVSSIPRPPFTRIEALGSLRKAMMYVSKYVAKAEKRCSGEGGFNSVTYLHAHTGRWWGVFNRPQLPLASARNLALFGQVMYRVYSKIRAAASEASSWVVRSNGERVRRERPVIPPEPETNATGFSLFLSDISEGQSWLDLLNSEVAALPPPRTGYEWQDSWSNRLVDYSSIKPEIDFSRWAISPETMHLELKRLGVQ